MKNYCSLVILPTFLFCSISAMQNPYQKTPESLLSKINSRLKKDIDENRDCRIVSDLNRTTFLENEYNDRTELKENNIDNLLDTLKWVLRQSNPIRAEMNKTKKLLKQITQTQSFRWLKTKQKKKTIEALQLMDQIYTKHR